MLIYKSKQKKFEGVLKIKLCGKRLHPTESVKNLGVKIDTNLSWQYHVNDLFIKLNKGNSLLFKLGNMFVLKYEDPFILLFLTPTYPTAVLSLLRTVALFNKF